MATVQGHNTGHLSDMATGQGQRAGVWSLLECEGIKQLSEMSILLHSFMVRHMQHLLAE